MVSLRVQQRRCAHSTRRWPRWRGRPPAKFRLFVLDDLDIQQYVDTTPLLRLSLASPLAAHALHRLF